MNKADTCIDLKITKNYSAISSMKYIKMQNANVILEKNSICYGKIGDFLGRDYTIPLCQNGIFSRAESAMVDHL